MQIPLIPALLSIATLGLAGAWMQEAKPERFSHPVSKDADGGMARWLETCKPSAAHARLAELLGTYDLTMRMWMAPGQPPMESKGSTEIKWLAEGKWLESRGSITMMGQQMTVASMLGFDNFKQRYVMCSVDSLQTVMNTASGHFDKTGNDLILWGQIDEPMTPEQDKTVKYVYRGFGQDRFVFEVHDMMIGETDTKVVEIEYRRRK